MKWTKSLLVLLLLLPLTSAMAELPTLAVVDFNTTSRQHGYLGKQTAELISDAVVNSGLFDVVERDKLQSILKEQSFSGGGLVDQGSAIQMGAMLGAQYLMTGEIIAADVAKNSFRGYGVTTTKTTYSLKVAVKVVDTKTGRVLFSGKETTSSSSQGTNNLHVNDRGSFVNLAERLSNKFADRLAASGKFSAQEEVVVAMVNVAFSSSPDSADVEVDSVFYGNAGDTLEVPGGMHSVKISLPGYDVWEKKVMLREGQKIKATLRKAADVRISHEES
jgi:curli biogenesis system outer membrane secretion channel CsgG